VQVHDTIMQLQKFDSLPADVEKAIENAQALVKDSVSSRRVRISLLFIYYLHCCYEELDIGSARTRS